MTSKSTALRKLLVCACLFALHGTTIRAQELDPEAVWQKYVRIVHGSTLEWRETEPFSLKIDYQLFDLEGKPSAQGSVNVAWGDGTDNATHIHSPSFPGLEKVNELPYNRESFLLNQVLEALIRPFPRVERRSDLVMDEFKRTFEAVELSCFALNAPGKTNEATTVYCTDTDNRLAALAGKGRFALLRKNFRKYRDRQVPLDLELSYNGKTAITAHLAELDVLQPGDSKRATRVDAESIVPADVITGAKIKNVNPKYPKQARKDHVAGTVLLCATITKEGSIRDLDVVASPDPLLSESAKQAVQKWTYHPYLLRGEPTEVETTIAVNYSLNR